MRPRLWLVFHVLALALVSGSCSLVFYHVEAVSRISTMGDFMGKDGKLKLDSWIYRRQLASSRYISYNVLKKNSVPCNRRGQSYYNCNSQKTANPYSRGCTAITRCKRFTG